MSLCNEINIVNSVQPWKEFLEGLAGGYTDKYGEEHEAEDKGQSYRRFPGMIILHEEDYDFMLNKGYHYTFLIYLKYPLGIRNKRELSKTPFHIRKPNLFYLGEKSL